MSRTKIDWNESWAKVKPGAVTGHFTSKRTEIALESLDKTAKRAKNVNKALKTAKKTKKTLNDAEIARRNVLYPYVASPKSPESIPNPNAAFRRKRLTDHLRGSPKTAAVTPKTYDTRIETEDGIFVLPARYNALYKDLRANDNSVEYAVDYIKEEIKQDEHFQQFEDELVEEWSESDYIDDDIEW